MTNQNLLFLNRRAIERLALASCLVLVCCLVFTGRASADPPTPSGAEKCAQCHEDETDAWGDSPHAAAVDSLDMPGAACEDCHGPYVEDHPKTGTMQLTVDSAICETCHTTTFDQWADSLHAQSGVQCIGCHLSHSQTFRLTDEALCGTCHKTQLEDFSCSVHDVADVSCTTCHLSSANFHPIAMADSGEAAGPVSAPGHDFTGVGAAECMNCHGQELHALSPSEAQQTDADMLVLAERVPVLTTQLKTVEQENDRLQAMTPISLGLGIGIGGFLGVVFMLIAGYISQGRKSS
jgi:hypothetical protein